MLARYWRIQVEDQDLIISPEDAQLARRKRRIIVIGSVVLVLAILFGTFGRRPAGQAIRAWQARRHAQKAFAFINKEQWDDARSEAMAAYQLRPDQLEALRAVVRYLTRLHSIEALDFWQSSDLFLQHLDALGGLGRWNEIEQEIRIGKFPLELFLAAMYLARFNSQLGEQTASANKQDEASGSALAVHAAIFAATNLENGKTEATQLKREQLLPEEQALVKSLLHG